jgi:F0F1-type ATP synthase delta subunit
MKRDILIYFDIITSIKTTQEADFLVHEIDNLMLEFFKSEKISIEKAMKSISMEFAMQIAQAFAKSNLDVNNRDTVTDFFKTLKKMIKKLKIIRIVMAFDPPYRTIENIHNFVKDNIGIGYILDIEISQDVLAGAVVIFNGEYLDYSLKKSIENTFSLKSKQIQQFYN